MALARINSAQSIQCERGNVKTTVIDARLWVAILSMAAMTACATRPAPDFGGRWKPVNRYAQEPQEIPLHQAYAFYPSPMDGTLKSMLERWARDSKMTLSYAHASDFTLHAGVADIRTSDLQQAAAQLSSAYAVQGVSVVVEGNQIVVRNSATATAGTSVDQAAATP